MTQWAGFSEEINCGMCHGDEHAGRSGDRGGGRGGRGGDSGTSGGSAGGGSLEGRGVPGGEKGAALEAAGGGPRLPVARGAVMDAAMRRLEALKMPPTNDAA